MEEADFKNLSKKEKFQLRKEQEGLQKQEQRKKDRLVNLGFVLLAVVLVIGVLLLALYLKRVEKDKFGKAQITPASFDLGKVSIAGGAVQTSFEIKNVGKGDLNILGVTTSCDCTLAKIKIDNVESPIFSMHPSGHSGWSGRLRPGEKGELIAIYDPKVHPVSGAITRSIIVSTDGSSKQTEVFINADVQP